MIDENFFGRVINKGKNSIKIENCEICLQRTSTWVEILGSNQEGFVLRLTCNTCHPDFESERISDHVILRSAENENPEIADTVRPGWVDEFIQSNENINNIEISDTLKTEPETNESWIKGFIDEALFGSNPVEWMEQNNLFLEDNANKNIFILGELSSNDLSNVKLSAIQCLFELYLRNKKFKEQIVLALNSFLADGNDIVGEFAKENIAKIV